MKTILLAGVALAGAALVGAPAKASIIVSLSKETAVSGGEDYTYAVTLSQDEQLNTAVQSVFFDLYNFGMAKLVGETGNLASGNWAFSNPYLNASMYAEGEKPNANPSIAALRFVYSGPIVTGPSLGTTLGNLGTFTVFTTYTGGYSVFNNDQDAQLAKYAPGQVGNNSPTSNLAAVAVPNHPAVPEPASIALLLTGIAGMCAYGYRRGPKNMPSRIG